MRISPKVLFSLLKETFQEWQDDKSSRLAAALAYYTVFSLAPLLIIAIAIAGAIFGEEAAQGELVGQMQGLVGDSGAEVIQGAIQNANKPDTGNIASIISIVVLLFGASGVFAQLQDALNTVWEVESDPKLGIWGFIRKRMLSFGAVFGIGFLLLVFLVVSAILTGLSNYMSDLIPGIDLLWRLLDLMISFVVITFLFALMYKYLPDVKIKWSDVWIGAALTSVLFAIGKYALGLYLGRSSFGSVYGAAGSLMVLLAWIYYAAQILFFGAEFTQVYARRYGSQIVPDEHAIPLSEESRTKQGIPKNRREKR